MQLWTKKVWECIMTWNNHTFVMNIREPPASCNFTGNMPTMLEKKKAIRENFLGKCPTTALLRMTAMA